ncbi:MAG: phosphoglycerate dehydrogenase [Coriobacteriales bacterium]|jgi:D-3-phosphoglycerate dehydrogenase|nr:phosphoglycerate dehydrogenase [Coriobacteriales bacterium]
MRVLIAEKLAPNAVTLLEAAGHTVDVKLGMTAEETIAAIGVYDALIVRSATKVTREVIEAGTNLKIIGRAGVGVDNVDVDAATERGIIVCNAPTSNVVSAAEQTMCLLLASARKTPQANASMQAGEWNRSAFTGNELFHKTLAIFGLGRIGGLIAERAASFGMELIGYDPYCSVERAASIGVTKYETVDEILPLADFITVHLPKTKETIGMFGSRQYARMKDGVYLVNTARGGIYNLAEMVEYLQNGKIAGAAIDVYESEPCTDSPVHGLDNVILTPHLGASTVEAQERAGIQIAEYVLLGLENKMVPTAVNVKLVPDDVMGAVAPYIPACETLGVILAQLSREAITSAELTVSGELAEYDVSILGTAALRGIFSRNTDDAVNFVNASYIATQRGVSITVVKDTKQQEYKSKVSLLTMNGSKRVEVGCIVSGLHRETRIVSLLDYKLDLIPRKYVLVMKYEDTPGKLGRIGTVLGNANINISTMEIGTLEKNTGEAVVLMNVDDPVSPEVYEELVDSVGVTDGWFIELL